MKRILSVLLVLIMLVGMVPLQAQHAHAAETKTYVKVTEAQDDWSGEYLIVYESGNVIFDGSRTSLDATSNTKSVTISSNTITTDSAYSFTIAKSGTSYTIKSASGYYIGQTSNANGLKSSTSTTYANTITINSDGSAHIVCSSAVLRYNKANDQLRFRYYKSGSYDSQQAICLYKLQESSVEPEETTTAAPVCEHSNTYEGTDGYAATCTTAGQTNTVYCSDCGEVVTEPETIPAGHKYENGVCTACGDVLPVVSFSVPSGVTAVADMTADENGQITLPGAGEPDGYTFAGWTTGKVDATTTKPTVYAEGDLFTATGATTLYALYSYSEGGSGTVSTDYVLTDIANIGATDEVVITMTYTDGTVYALSSANGTSSAPAATTVTVSNNKLSNAPAATLVWNVANENGNLTIYPNGTTAIWLYCTNTNNGVRVGTNANSSFTIDATSGYLKNTATSRYVGVYRSNPDWRCYTNTTGNIAGQTLRFFVKSSTAAGTTYYTTEIGTTTECEHSYDEVVTAPTCTEDGYTTYTCSKCGDSYTGNTVTALGHDYEGVITQAATCTAEGVMTYTCKNDATHSYTEAIPVIDHNYVDGICSVCGAEKPQITEYKLVDTSTIAAGNFVIGAVRSGEYPAVYLATSKTSSGDWVVGDTAVSATNDTITSLNLPEGTQVFTLEGNNTDGFTIGYNNGTEMVYLGYTAYSGRKLAFSASYNTFLWTLQVNDEGEFYLQTITDAGKYLVSQNSTGTSAIRGYSNNTVYTGIYLFGAMCDHSYGEGVVTDPTCTADGYTTYTCSKCGGTYTDNVVAALGHDFENGTVTKPATCTETGTKKCARCDVTQEIPATGHTPGDTAEIVEATCEEKGSKTYTCTVCGSPIVEEIPALGHKYDDGVVTTPATCTAAGVKTYTCQNDPSHTYTEAVPAIGHNYNDSGVCENCGSQVERFMQVSDITEILEGGRFVIAAVSGDEYVAMGTTLTGGELNAVTGLNFVTEGSETYVVYEEGLPIWTVGAIDGKSVSLYNGEIYLGYGTSGTSFISSGTEYAWVVRQNDDGTTYITHSSEFVDRAISLTTMGSFKPYSTTQANYNRNLYLFKVVAAEDAQNLTLTFKENNNVTTTATVAHGGVYQMPEPSKAVPAGYDKFIGWVTLPTAETLVKPTTIYKAGEYYLVTGDKTFYALYSRYDENEDGLDMVYHPVTEQSQITLGGKYLIVAPYETDDGTVYYAMEAAQRSNNRGSVIVTMNEDGTITVGSDVNAAILQLDNGTVDGTYALLDIKMDMYLYCDGGYLRSTSEISSSNGGAYSFDIVVNSDDTATMEAQVDADRSFIRFNTTAQADGVLIFNCYKEDSNQAVSLYYGVSTDSGATFYSTIICEHNYVKDSAASKDPTCTDSGYARYTCSLCGDTYVEVLPATGHTMSDEAEIVTPATCTTDGVANYTCVTCGIALENEVIPATGHNYGEGVATAKTDSETAYITYTCQNGCGESYKTKLMFTTASLTVANKLSLNFKVDASVFADGVYSLEGVKAVFTLGYRVGDYALTVDKYTIEEDEKGLPKYYVFECYGINPSQIGDVVTATLYASYNGTTYESLALTEYSVATYCENLLRDENSSDELKTLLVDLLNYGTAAKVYTKYYTEAEKAAGVQILPNAGLTAEELALGTTENPAVNNVYKINAMEGSTNAVAWKAAGLVLTNSVTLRFRFYAPEGVEGLYVVLQMGGSGYVLNKFVEDTTRDDQYYVYFTALNAYQLNETVTLTIRDQNHNIVGNQLVYSVASYVANKTASATVADDFKELLWVMMKYGNSAKAYIESNS